MRVLRGAELFLKQFYPTLCVEINEECLHDNNSSGQELRQYLAGLGYHCYMIDGPRLREVVQLDPHYPYLNYFFIK